MAAVLSTNGTFHATSTGGNDTTVLVNSAPPEPDAGQSAQYRLYPDGTTKANYDPTNMSDDMPNLKSLMIQQGLTFTKNYVSIALCCPSRATNYTGRYAHNTLIYDLGR